MRRHIVFHINTSFDVEGLQRKEENAAHPGGIFYVSAPMQEDMGEVYDKNSSNNYCCLYPSNIFRRHWMSCYVLAKPGKLANGLKAFVNQTRLFRRVIMGTNIQAAESDPGVLSCDFVVLKDDFELQATVNFIITVRRQNPNAKFLVLANNLDRASTFQTTGVEMVILEEKSFEQLAHIIQQIYTNKATDDRQENESAREQTSNLLKATGNQSTYHE